MSRNTDYQYCKATECEKKELCNRWYGNYEIEGSFWSIDYLKCIASDFSIFEKLKSFD